MRSNKEFLEGIYKKAEVLERKKAKRNIVYKNLIRYSSVAAIFIILPLLVFNNQIFWPKPNIENPIEPRIMMANDPKSNFIDADYILIGTIDKVKDNEFNLFIDKVLYGNIEESQIIIRSINSEFTEGKRSLFFLNKDEDNIYYLIQGNESQFNEIEKDVFVDSYGNIYNLEDIKNNIDRRQ